MRLAILAIVVATSAYVLHAQRPHTHMAGGISEVNVQDAHVKEAAHKAVELLNEDGKLRGTLNGATGPVQLVSIEKVESQVRFETVSLPSYLGSFEAEHSLVYEEWRV